MIPRRDVLKLAVAGLGASATARAFAQPAPAATAPAAVAPDFDASHVTTAARELAKQPFAAPSADLPAPFGKLSYDQYVSIRQRPGSAIWANENVGFALEPLHRGFVFSAPMVINIVENGRARRLGYDAGRFDFGTLQVPNAIPDIGYSGFRVLQPQRDGLHDVAIFQGASFFRAIARGQNFGVVSRALSIRTGDPKGEEFPVIREVWIERPSLATNALVLHALVDSESVTGAYRFTLRPGDITIADIECTLFTRAAVDGLGLGTMAAMSFFGPQGGRRGIEDVREAVYDAGGLQVLNSNGEWLWRPVANRETLQLSSFMNNNPRGFGMLQRERRFDSFQDDDQHWELRPSLWVEPLSDWGEGSVVLVEIPSDSEVNDNIVCFWRPKAPLAAKAEMSFSYRQSWSWTPLERPGLSVVTDTRVGRGTNARRRNFIVEFSNEAYGDPAHMADLVPAVSASGGTISAIRTFPLPLNKAFRVHFELEPNADIAELRLVLEQSGKAASETWLYRWTS